MADEFEIDVIGSLNPELQFELDEAVSLINHEVINQQDQPLLPNIPMDKVGIVVGVLWLNEEVEIIIRIGKDLAQVTKQEYLGNFLLID